MLKCDKASSFFSLRRPRRQGKILFCVSFGKAAVFREETLCGRRHLNSESIFILETDDYGKPTEIFIYRHYVNAESIGFKPSARGRHYVIITRCVFRADKVGITFLRKMIVYI